MRNLYWLIVAVVLATITHIATLLFVPGFVFERNLRLLTADIPSNTFFILPKDAQHKVFPEYPAATVFGLCRFNLSSGTVSLNANLPDTFWTLTIYTRSGKSIYTVNDQQSGTNTFSLKVVMAPTILDLFSAKDDTDDPVESSGWKVQSSDRHGFALFWVPSIDPAMRENLVETLSKSTCVKTAS